MEPSAFIGVDRRFQTLNCPSLQTHHIDVPSRHPTWHHSRFSEDGIQAPRKPGQVVARNLWVQMVLEMVREFEEESRNDMAPKGVGLRKWRISVVSVREMNGEKREHPHSRVHQPCIEE